MCIFFNGVAKDQVAGSSAACQNHTSRVSPPSQCAVTVTVTVTWLEHVVVVLSLLKACYTRIAVR
jgi:hypothetical protein